MFTRLSAAVIMFYISVRKKQLTYDSKKVLNEKRYKNRLREVFRYFFEISYISSQFNHKSLYLIYRAEGNVGLSELFCVAIIYISMQ